MFVIYTELKCTIPMNHKHPYYDRLYISVILAFTTTSAAITIITIRTTLACSYGHGVCVQDWAGAGEGEYKVGVCAKESLQVQSLVGII